MLRRACAPLVLCLAFLVLAAPADANPATRAAVTVHIVLQWNDAGLWTRDFELRGAVAASGLVTPRVVAERHGEGGRVTRNVRYILRGGRGRLVLASRQHTVVDQATWTQATTGRWWIVRGTGAFAGLAGGGAIDETGTADSWYEEHAWAGTVARSAPLTPTR